MNIYKIYRTDDIDDDEFVGAVIVAKDEIQVRKIASENMKDFTDWFNESIAKVEIVIPNEARIVLMAFNAG